MMQAKLRAAPKGSPQAILHQVEPVAGVRVLPVERIACRAGRNKGKHRAPVRSAPLWRCRLVQRIGMMQAKHSAAPKGSP